MQTGSYAGPPGGSGSNAGLFRRRIVRTLRKKLAKTVSIPRVIRTRPPRKPRRKLTCPPNLIRTEC